MNVKQIAYLFGYRLSWFDVTASAKQVGAKLCFRSLISKRSLGTSRFINVSLLATISIKIKLFCYENVKVDHTLQAICKENSPKLFLRKESMDTTSKL